ncbi:MAG: ABC transporter substrate-binding protein [Dehalococcoidia bacterium]|nr:ABC transporter substrate-binding protein [Dehalococcoidia bacterium]
MQIKKVLTYLVPIACILSLLSITACGDGAQPPEEQKTLKLGCIMPFSGSAAMYGERGRQTVDCYVELLNEDGGVKIGDDTYKIDLLWGDGQWTPAGAAAAARKLIYDDDIIAIVGYIGPGFSALSPVTNPEKVILITRTGSLIYSPKKDPYVVFGTPTGEITLNQALAVMDANPNLHTLCWTGSTDDRRISESAFEVVDKMFLNDFGIKNIRVYYPVGTTNFTPYISKMAELETEVIFLGGTILEVALMAKQRWEMGYKWPIGHTSDSLVDILFGICGKEAAQGIMGNRINPLELKKVTVAPKYMDMTQCILDRYENNYGKPLDNYGTFSTAVTQLSQYIECAQSIGTTDPDQMMKAFYGGTFDSFVGNYTYTGSKTYGEPIVFGSPCSMGIIKGDEDVYLGEYPLKDADMWYDYMTK